MRRVRRIRESQGGIQRVSSYLTFRAKYAGVKRLMQRPARKQVNEAKWGTAYVEGNYDYNIWYDKYLSDRSVEQERAPALYMCDPDLDTGFTKADLF